MEDGFFDYPNSDTHGRALVAIMSDRILGFDSAYISREEILLSLDCDNSKGSALIPPYSDKGHQRT
jgi:hypothetical protein